MQPRARPLDIDGYMTADEASALLHQPGAGLLQAVTDLGILLVVLLGFAGAFYAVASRFGINL